MFWQHLHGVSNSMRSLIPKFRIKNKVSPFFMQPPPLAIVQHMGTLGIHHDWSETIIRCQFIDVDGEKMQNFWIGQHYQNFTRQCFIPKFCISVYRRENLLSLWRHEGQSVAVDRGGKCLGENLERYLGDSGGMQRQINLPTIFSPNINNSDNCLILRQGNLK